MNAPAIAFATSIITSLCASLDRRAFAAALARLKHIVPRRAALPALEGVLIESVPGALFLTATDANVFVRVAIAATVTDHGALLVPFRRLAEITKGPAAGLQLAGDTITAVGVTHRLTTLPAATFPAVPPPTGDVLFTLLRPTLATALRRTSYAMSCDTTRPHLSAMFIERRANELRFVATDGHRLALTRLADAGRDFSVLVGRQTIEEVEHMVGAFGGLVRLQREGDRVWFVAGDEFVTGPIVEAVLPRYEQVIPATAEGQVTLTTAELTAAIAALSPRGDAGIKLRFERLLDRVTLSVDDGDGGTAQTTVAASYAGTLPESLGINSRYLREMLGALSDDDHTVTFEVNGELDPVRVEGGGTAVVMPMRL